MKQIKILRIISRLNIGGPAIHAVLLTAKLDNDTFESNLITGEIQKHESDMTYFARKLGVKPIFISGMRREIAFLHDVFCFFKLYKMIRLYKPDIVHTHTAKAGFVGRIAALLAGIRIRIHTFHGNIFKGYFGKTKTQIFITLEKILALITTEIITISSQQKDELLELKIARSDKITIIRLGFDFNYILPSRSQTNKFKLKYDIPQNSKIIGIIGRLTQIKNHKLFIDIAEILLRKYDNIYFPIIGDGELRDELQKIIDKKLLNKRVFITGFIQNLKPVYTDLDVVLLTSFNEGTPVAIIESMASGKLVCCTNVGGISDFIEHGIDGFYFDSQEPQPFVNIIEDWIEDPKSYKEIMNNAKQTAIRFFDVSILVNNIECLYNRLLERN